MNCSKCGSENPDGAKFCSKCGEKLEKICPKCKTEIDENAKFCQVCGYNLAEPEAESKIISFADIQNDAEKTVSKINKTMGIVTTVAGGIALLNGFSGMPFDWGLISLIAGAGLLTVGILELRKALKYIGIIEICFGGALLLISFMGDVEVDWVFLGVCSGIVILVSGLLKQTKKSVKTISIVDIVLSAFLLLMGLDCIDFVWGEMAIAVAVPYLAGGIWRLNKLKCFQ